MEKLTAITTVSFFKTLVNFRFYILCKEKPS